MHDNINIVSTEQKLLYDIRELLIEQNKILKHMTVIRPMEVIEKVKEEITPPIKINGLECVQCGNIHENTGSKLACAKKYKNKGA